MRNEFAQRLRVSGLETENGNWITGRLSSGFDEVRLDRMGNVIAKKGNDPRKKTLLLATHWDEPGFIVTKITEDGYLKFEPVGKVPKEALLSKKVDVNGHTGVISLKAIHLSTREEREKPVETADLFVDIGAQSVDEAKELVLEGDYFTFKQEMDILGDYVTGRGIDSAAAMEILIQTAEEIKNYNVILLLYAQRHVGMRGLRTAIPGLQADISILVEGIDWKHQRGEAEEEMVYHAPLLCYAAKNYLAPQELTAKVERIARDAGMALHKTAIDTAVGAEMFTAAGIPAVYLGFNCRNQGTAVCMVREADIENIKELLRKIGEEI